MIELRTAQGRKGIGGHPKPSAGKVEAVKRLYNDGSITIQEICEVFKISRATLYRYLKKQP